MSWGNVTAKWRLFSRKGPVLLHGMVVCDPTGLVLSSMTCLHRMGKAMHREGVPLVRVGSKYMYLCVRTGDLGPLWATFPSDA